MKLQKVMAFLGALAFVAGFGLAREARAAEVIKIGTLAPRSSTWGMVFTVWEKAVKEKSSGRLELQFFYNGTQGDEDAMIAKIKGGQLHGAAVTGVGLGKVYKPILALQMPGLFTSWSKLDKARDALKTDFEKGAKDAGFFISGWFDVGLVRTMSKGFAIKVPGNLKGKKPHYIRADAILPVLYSTIGGVSGVPLNVPEVLPNLNTGAVNVVSAPCLAAEQLQWAGKLDNLNDAVIATAIGAVVFSSKTIDALPADLKAILTDTGKVAVSALTTKVRSEDDAACSRLKAKMTVTTPSADDKTKWEAVFKQTRQKLGQGTFSPDLVKKVEGYAK
ncbi:TRAP transporter substrate-binding protein DctP [Sorangium sp. So ce341]|uniref:TRAP transporter substrate-binding protein DctP n=1 Tax=Sorangium sp. So ce341 TaxID=3133302 RepID=UPI003F5F3BA6